MNSRWVALNFPYAKKLSFSDVLDEKLKVKSVKSTSMEIDGVVLLDFFLGDCGETLPVPFIVTYQTLIELKLVST